MVDAVEDWASANNANGTPTTQYAINLSNGTMQTSTPSGLDDTYMGYKPFVTGDQQTVVWDLSANTQNTYTPALTAGNGWQGSQVTAHMGILNGYWIGHNTEGSDTQPMPVCTVAQADSAAVVIGSQSVLPYNPKYWGQFHTSGNWWLQGSGTNQYFVQSNFETAAAAPGPASELYAISFINVWAGTSYRLGHSYSVYQAVGSISEYYTQPHGHISHDGKLVMFGSDMLGNSRVVVFVMEVPLIAGTPPSFP
jgi:hypothetical protein